MSRHFFWLIPITNFLIFAFMGTVLAIASIFAPRIGSWVGVRTLAAVAMLPALIVLIPEVYTLAWFLLAFGVAIQLAPVLERRSIGFRRFVALSFPVLFAVEVSLAGWVLGKDWLKARHETQRPTPSANAPNVLLIVLDTVRADRLSAYGYDRETTPTLERFATRGVRFNEAHATSSWTLPSHGSMFTGQLPDQLKADWVSPIDTSFPTLADYLASHGYATSGFVGNTLYCSYDTGLAKGFTHYEDYNLEQLDALLMSRLTERALLGFFQLSNWVRGHWQSQLLAPVERFVQQHVYASNRKNAATVNRDFIAWLSTRQNSQRPFFAFLNYIDAHDAYFPPPGTGFAFGLAPKTANDFTVLQNWESLDKRKLHPHFQRLASDCYDDCLRYIDDQLFVLFSKLSAQGALANTLVVITADHGESFGEHGFFRHGNSLYRPEIHVPLLIAMPGLRPVRRVVDDVVSLRDLPATIVDLLGLSKQSPFPGRSLAQAWSRPAPDLSRADPVISQLRSPNPVDLHHQATSPAQNGPIEALIFLEGKYINEGDVERLFGAPDIEETQNRADDASMRVLLKRCRDTLKKRVQPRL